MHRACVICKFLQGCAKISIRIDKYVVVLRQDFFARQKTILLCRDQIDNPTDIGVSIDAQGKLHLRIATPRRFRGGSEYLGICYCEFR